MGSRKRAGGSIGSPTRAIGGRYRSRRGIPRRQGYPILRFLLAEILNFVLHDARGADILLRLTSIAKITRGFSTAIITSQYSELADWVTLVGVAVRRRLKAATTGPTSPVGIGFAMVERRMGLSFDRLETASTTAAADLVRTRRADLAAVETRLALLHNSRDSSKFRIITTFGARRSRALPQIDGPSAVPQTIVRDKDVAQNLTV